MKWLQVPLRVERFAMGKTWTLANIYYGHHRWYGLEKPWRDNRPGESCIPAGLYYLEPHDSAKFGQVWAFVGGTVSHQPDSRFLRSACLIHAGNRASDVHGCLAIGRRMHYLPPEGSEPVLEDSRSALDDLRRLIGTTNVLPAQVFWTAGQGG